VFHKKFVLAIIAASVLAVAVSIIILSSSPQTDSASNIDGRTPKIEETSGEVSTTLPFFHRVDDNYLRGSQPAHGGIATLVSLGVHTLVDLRSKYDRTDDIKEAAEAAGLEYEWVPTSVWDPPTDDEANRFVSLVTKTERGPFFVFCADGLNRIGEMTAIYRIAHDNWSVQKALDEADELGFSPYYYNLRSYVWDYARKFRPNSVPPNGRRISLTGL